MKRFVPEAQWIEKHYGRVECGHERYIDWDGDIIDWARLNSVHTTLGELPAGLELVDTIALGHCAGGTRFVGAAVDVSRLREYIEQFCHWKHNATALLYSEAEEGKQ